MGVESRPISLIISFLLVLTFFTTKQVPSTLCIDNASSSMFRNFHHVDSSHLMVNLFAFNSLSRIESKIGSGSYTVLLFLIT